LKGLEHLLSPATESQHGLTQDMVLGVTIQTLINKNKLAAIQKQIKHKQYSSRK
jgi:hypothetical protein